MSQTAEAGIAAALSPPPGPRYGKAETANCI